MTSSKTLVIDALLFKLMGIDQANATLQGQCLGWRADRRDVAQTRQAPGRVQVARASTSAFQVSLRPQQNMCNPTAGFGPSDGRLTKRAAVSRFQPTVCFSDFVAERPHAARFDTVKPRIGS